MKTNKNYILRSIAGEAILVPTGSATSDFNGMINLSEVAAFIWNQIDASADLEDLVQKVVAEYDVEEATARKDTAGFIESLIRNKMIEL